MSLKRIRSKITEVILFILYRIFMFINMSLILSAIWPSKLLCACLIWLAVNAVFLLCLAMNIKRDLPIWVPGISHNPYLNWLITDPGK